MRCIFCEPYSRNLGVVCGGGGVGVRGRWCSIWCYTYCLLYCLELQFALPKGGFQQLQGWGVWGIVKTENPQEFSPKREKPHSKIWGKNETAMINNDAVIALSFSLLSCQLGSIKLK